MDFVTGKSIERRTFLRGMGATVALPFLDAMVPAGRRASSVAAELDRTRFVAVEMVHGAAGSNEWGATQNLWAPAAVGRDFDLTPSSLLPLDPWREHLTIISNTDVRMAEAFEPHEIGGDHFRSSAVFLTQSHPKQTQGSDLFVGTSLDQIHARRFGQDTPLPSMQFTIPNIDQAGGCTYNYSCAYTDSISWASPSEPLPMIRDPRVAFDMLFGAGGTPAERASRRKARASILDWITGEVATIRSELGSEDRQRMEQYLDNVREIERRIQAAEQQAQSSLEIPESPAGVPHSYEEHVGLMFDLMALAYQTDVTRVITFMMARELSFRSYPQVDVPDPHHSISHHQNDAGKMERHARINTYHVTLFSRFLEKLRNIPDGDGSLLDHSMIVYGSGMANGNQHTHNPLPTVVVGGANGRHKGNRHLLPERNTPMGNFLLSVLDRAGGVEAESVGLSTGRLEL